MRDISFFETNDYLENEFAKLGFNLKDLLPSAKYVSHGFSMLSKEIDDNDQLIPGDIILFSFTVSTPRKAGLQGHIELIHVFLLRKSLFLNNVETLIEKKYWNDDYTGLPTKEQICTELMKL